MRNFISVLRPWLFTSANKGYFAGITRKPGLQSNIKYNALCTKGMCPFMSVYPDIVALCINTARQAGRIRTSCLHNLRFLRAISVKR